MSNQSGFSPDDIQFNVDGLVPAIVQEATTKKVLMLAYMNKESLEKTLETGLTWFYSRSRKKLWQKGESSGHVQRVKSIWTDCDQDAIHVEVDQEGGVACHTGAETCFHHHVRGGLFPVENTGATVDSPDNEQLLDVLYHLIQTRKADPVEGSYTSYLFREGIDKILKKVGEENTEVLIAAKDRDEKEFVAESADLLYHLLVLMAELEVEPGKVWAELSKRRGGGGGEDTPPGK